MPFARHQRAIAALLHQIGDTRDPVVQIALISRMPRLVRAEHLRHRAKPGLMIVDPAHQHRSRRRTGRRGVEPGEAHARERQLVEVGRVDVAAERAEIRPAEIIRDDQQDVRSLCRGQCGRRCGCSRGDKVCAVAVPPQTIAVEAAVSAAAIVISRIGKSQVDDVAGKLPRGFPGASRFIPTARWRYMSAHVAEVLDQYSVAVLWRRRALHHAPVIGQQRVEQRKYCVDILASFARINSNRHYQGKVRFLVFEPTSRQDTVAAPERLII